METDERKIFYSGGKLDLFQVLAFVAIMVFLAVVLYAGYLSLLEDNPPLTYNDIEVLTPIVAPGETFSLKLDFCKHTNSPGEIFVTWLNDDLTFQVPVENNTPPGCYLLAIDSPVPVGLHPGMYTRRTEVVYPVNSLAVRSVSYELPVEVVELR